MDFKLKLFVWLATLVFLVLSVLWRKTPNANLVIKFALIGLMIFGWYLIFKF